jgi:hypothetical protein
MTGRGMGYCRDYDQTGYANTRAGRGFGMGWSGGRGGFGLGRGWGRGYGRGWGRGSGYPQPGVDVDAAFLRAESTRIIQQLDEIEKRLAEFEKED